MSVISRYKQFENLPFSFFCDIHLDAYQIDQPASLPTGL